MTGSPAEYDGRELEQELQRLVRRQAAVEATLAALRRDLETIFTLLDGTLVIAARRIEAGKADEAREVLRKGDFAVEKGRFLIERVFGHLLTPRGESSHDCRKQED